MDASSIAIGLGLPLGMVLANRSAAFVVTLGALLALGGVWQSGRWPDLMRRLRQTPPILAWVGMAFVLFATASIGWSHFPKVAGFGLGEFLIPLCAALVLGFCYTVVPPRRIGVLLAVGLCLAAVAAIVDLKTGMAFRHKVGIRTHDYVLNRSVVAQLLLLFPMLALVARRYLWLGALAVVLVAAAIAVSQSGSAKLGLLAGALGLLVARLVPGLAARGLGLATALAILVSPWIGAIMARLLPARIVQAGRDAHAGDRIEIWKSFGAAVEQRPIFGSGFNASARMADDPVVAQVAAPLREMLGAGHPHNALLQVWVDLGAVGALLAVAIVVLTSRAMLALPPRVQPLAVGLGVAVYAIAAVSHGAWQAWWIAAVGASIAVLRLAARET